ncbi:MAG TPA: sigma-70 family RNA polymerase sigma factor [Streptosporangiaceae bacterium]
MRDRDIVAAIVANDPAGLAAAYDRYAADLFSYCQILLTEPADAADAVQDTFVIAAQKVSALRDPERLRPWLYAVARNECHRRLRSQDSATPLDESAEVSDDTADLGAGLEQAQIRELVWAALAGLTESEREIIELTLGHELTGADLADTLGVPRNQAHAMASRARAHFEAALGVLLVARSGQEACAELASIMTGWDGKLTVLLRKRVSRHIRRCAICGARRRRELTPDSLLGVLPVAVLPIALRHQVLSLVADSSPAAAARRLAIGQRLGPVGPSGFPRPVSPPSALGLAGQHMRAGTAAGGAIIVGGALVGGVLLHHHLGHGPDGPPGAHPEPSVASPARPSAGSGGSAAPAGGVAALAGGGQPASSRPAAASTGGSGTPPAGTTVSASASVSAAVGVTGTLSVSPLHLGLGLSLGGSWRGTLTLTAVGGPVSDYHVTVPAAVLQDITLSRTSGSLAAGQSVRITVTAAGGGLFSTAILDVDPGGLSVVVSYNLNL